ncbi:MAG TPA: hypothetical protein VN281_09640 [Verrucomicrobiae bacterium]|nr:hypothetical protein [Verrucomicrobiae bacterium]
MLRIVVKSVDRYTQKANIKAAERRRILAEVNQLATDIARCERTIGSVVTELNSVNAKYQGPRTTREEIEFLKVLLDCAKRKLAWEKQIASLKRRAPAVLDDMTKIMNDTDHPLTDELKTEMLQALQSVQGALQRLQAIQTND